VLVGSLIQRFLPQKIALRKCGEAQGCIEGGCIDLGDIDSNPGLIYIDDPSRRHSITKGNSISTTTRGHKRIPSSPGIVCLTIRRRFRSTEVLAMEDPVDVKRIGVSEVYTSEATPEVE
jgi:hypothetical protein